MKKKIVGNPYSRFLGLPEATTQPDHYQLLGIEQFTNDIRKIKNAAAIQTNKLKKWQNNDELYSQVRTLEMKVASAMLVLTNTEKKKAYDIELRRSTSTVEASVVQVEIAGHGDAVEQAPLWLAKFRENPTLMAVATGVVLTIPILILFWVLLKSSDDASKSARQTAVEEGNSATTTLKASPDSKKNIEQAPVKPASREPSFNQMAAQTGQQVRADFLSHIELETNSVGMKLVFIPPGTFMMGSPNHEKNHRADEHQVEVTLTEGFWLGQTEVTEQQWKQVMGNELWRGWHRNSRKQENANYPAANISWEDATAFCQRLTETERKAGRLTADREYALPTEAQWEYACRAGTKTVYSFGNDIAKLGDHAWFENNADREKQTHPHPVATKKANPWGLYDMHGNVWEWCRDWYEPRLTGGRDPLASTAGSARILRGGCCWRNAGECRSGARSRSIPSNRYYSLGFRVALVPSSEL